MPFTRKFYPFNAPFLFLGYIRRGCFDNTVSMSLSFFKKFAVKAAASILFFASPLFSLAALKASSRPSPNATQVQTQTTQVCGEKTKNLTLFEKNGCIEHLFTHNLIAHPKIAFEKGNAYGKHLDRDCLTPTEFKRILKKLHENGYALIDAKETFSVKDGKAERIAFSFPRGKKPLILSFDDVVYARKNLGKGTADRLECDENGNDVYAVTTMKNDEIVRHREEFVPILEDFIKEYPDFSFNGARGIIFLTGFDGILGYRTDRNSPNLKEETKKALFTANALKEKGWIFGCHSYAHGHMQKYSAEQMKNDVQKWKTEVEPIVGKTPLYAYPYGERALGENGDDERQKALTDAEFCVFYGVGKDAFYAKMPLKSKGERHLFQDRCPMDGISLRANLCSRFFNCQDVYDETRPMSDN